MQASTKYNQEPCIAMQFSYNIQQKTWGHIFCRKYSLIHFTKRVPFAKKLLKKKSHISFDGSINWQIALKLPLQYHYNVITTKLKTYKFRGRSKNKDISFLDWTAWAGVSDSTRYWVLAYWESILSQSIGVWLMRPNESSSCFSGGSHPWLCCWAKAQRYY